MSNGRRLPTVEELKTYQVNDPNQFEVTRQSLYDRQTYDGTNGNTILTFFQDPIGQGGKTKEFTNMESAGQLPMPKNFIVTSIELHIFPGIDIGTEGTAAETEFANDIYTIAKHGYLDFFIGSKSFLTEAPLVCFPPKTRLYVTAAHALQLKQEVDADETLQVSTEYAAFDGRPYAIDPRITLIPNQNFNVTLNWPTGAKPLPSGEDASVFIKLDGLLYRWIQ
jgi:hypothetical protein